MAGNWPECSLSCKTQSRTAAISFHHHRRHLPLRKSAHTNVIWTWYDTFCKKVNMVRPCEWIIDLQQLPTCYPAAWAVYWMHLCTQTTLLFPNLTETHFTFPIFSTYSADEKKERTCHKSCPSQRLYARKDVFIRGNSNVLLVSLLFVLSCFY